MSVIKNDDDDDKRAVYNYNEYPWPEAEDAKKIYRYLVRFFLPKL